MPSLLSPAFPPWGRRTGFRVPHSLVIERSRRGLSAPVSLMEVAIKKRPVCCCRTEEQGTGRNTTAGGRGSLAPGVLTPFTVGQLLSLGRPLQAPLPPFRSAPVCSSAHGLSHFGRWSSAAINKNQKVALSLMLYSKICALISEVLHFCHLKPWPDLT